ncbi:MAG: hypothetical protein ABJA62_10330 [Luteimonas sp.]
MHHFTRALYAVLASIAMLVASFGVLAQDHADTAVISIYRVAPGKHLEFLKWMAAREATAKEAGIGATQWYRHLDGDSWDYIAIAPDTDEAMDDKSDAMAKKHGMAVGMKAGFELRALMASHTDTLVAGPTTAAAMVQKASEP